MKVRIARRLACWLVVLASGWVVAYAAPPDYPVVTPGATLSFPRAAGAHPLFRTEWWYVTGWLRTPDQAELGFQVTFFRSRPELDESNDSAFAPRQLLFAHVALADPAVGHLLHDQRAARAGFGLAQAALDTTRVHIDDWSLVRDAQGVYHSHIPAADFTLEVDFTPSQPRLLQGDAGYSRKGPQARQASYYYSEPQLQVRGSLVREGERLPVEGVAWLDHEWSSELLSDEAVGWDWVGLNFPDGSALMAFRIRDAAGETLWSDGTWRAAGKEGVGLRHAGIRFRPLRWWQSPRTGTRYPVALQLQAGPLSFRLEPLMADQELDSRATTGTVYWEGAVRARPESPAAQAAGTGQGYLELTGYDQAIGF